MIIETQQSDNANENNSRDIYIYRNMQLISKLNMILDTIRQHQMKLIDRLFIYGIE